MGDFAAGLTQHALGYLKDVQHELAERKLEALRLYEPMPLQDEFHRSLCSERIVIGGNRCLAGEQELVDPETGEARRIDSIERPFKVTSMVDGKTAVYTASAPFIKGLDKLYAIDLSNGQQLRATLEHRVLCDTGWESVERAWQNRLPLKSASGEPVLIERVEYLRMDYYWDITVPGPHNYLAAGVFSHNSGKSLSTFVEDARAATGQDPYNKYPKEDGNLVIVGRGWGHIGMVVYPMLFKAGAFRIIKDEVTGQWRAFRPATDEPRRKESKPAPPLIPPRFVKEFSWVLKNAGYLNKATLINGWTIHCFSSEGEPPQGFQADIVHIDEDLSNESWIGEMLARLADRKGRFVWSAMPHSKNDALLGMCERAEKEVESNNPNPMIKKFTLRFLDNAHIDQEEKRKNIERWSSLGQDELRMRAEGEFTTESTLMYPNFNQSVHVLSRQDLPQVPEEWTKYVAIDPGHTVMATLFAAVPPDERFLLFYDELYLRNANALIWGEEFCKKAKNQSIRSLIMDMHGGALRDLGSGRLPHELYSEQLRKHGFKAEITGTSFIPGSDDIPARTSIVRQMMHIRGDGSTRFKILEGACPNLIRELKRYRKKTTTVNGQVYVTDEPYTRGEVHACQTAEYLCAYEPKYHKPPKSYGPDPWWVSWLTERQKRKRAEAPDFIFLGASGAKKDV
jgi:hypothetical protein